MGYKISKDRFLLLTPDERRELLLSESGVGGDSYFSNGNEPPAAWFDGAFSNSVVEKPETFMKNEGMLNEVGDLVQHSGHDWTWPLTHLPGIGWLFTALFAILGLIGAGINTGLIFAKLKRLMRRLVYRTEYGKEKSFKIIPEIFRKNETPPCYDQLERNMERTVYTQTDIVLHAIGKDIAPVDSENEGGKNE